MKRTRRGSRVWPCGPSRDWQQRTEMEVRRFAYPVTPVLPIRAWLVGRFIAALVATVVLLGIFGR